MKAPTVPVAVAVLSAAAMVAAVALRFRATSPLWLDEALTVNIARLPLRDLVGALRQDGAPPLYFALLHVWTAVFGQGDVAVRALSGVLSVATLPVTWLAGRRLGGQRVAWAALLLLAASPFAIRYATEARMYSLLTLLAVIGYLAVVRALERPTLPHLGAVAVVTGLLLLTHYWSLFLLAAVASVLVAWVIRGCSPSAPRVLAAVAAGSLLFAPWLGVFAFQLRHTGTPWAKPAGPTALLSTIAQYSGGPSTAGRALGLLVVVLAGLGALGRAVDGRHVEIDLLGRPPGRWLALVFGGSLALAVAAGLVTRTGIEARYTAASFPMLILLAALGARVLQPGRVSHAAVGTAVALGLIVAVTGSTESRTQAGEVAAALAGQVRAGDVVAYCPDQLGPAVSRLLPGGTEQLTFPDGSPPALVDWTDYARRQAASDVDAFAAGLQARTASGSGLWLVWGGGYRSLGDRCEQLHARLAALRPAREIVYPVGTTRSVEAAHLTSFPPG
ncbi:MAG: glycosyltransferase family 39 protein [Acidimicrobiales bacterium]